MYGKFRRKVAKTEVSSAHPENITIVLKRAFAKALYSNQASTELDALHAVVNDRGLDLKNCVQEAQAEQVKIAKDGDLGKFEKKFFSWVMKRAEKADRNKLSVKIDFDDLDSFLDDLTKDTVAPAINRVYAGNTRVL